MHSQIFAIAAFALAALTTGCTIVTTRGFDVAEPAELAQKATPVAEGFDEEGTPDDDLTASFFVESKGSYWPARMLSRLPDGRAAVHYESRSSGDDELVASARLFVESLNRTRSRRGEHLFVEWQGSYWPATVIATEGATARIHYDGYGPEWDETVGPDRTKRLISVGP